MRTLTAVIVLGMFTGSRAAAQDVQVPGADVVLDFSSLAVEGLPRNSGDPIRIAVKNLNALCFSPSIKVTFREAAHDVSSAQAMFRAGTKPSGTESTIPTSPSRDVQAAAYTHFPTQPTLESQSARALVEGARRRLDMVEGTRQRVHEMNSTLDAMKCESSWDISTLLRRWAIEREDLIEQIPQLETWVAAARTALVAAEAMSDGRQGNLPREIASLRARADTVETEASSVVKPFQSTRVKLDMAAEGSTLIHSVDTHRDHSGISVQVTGSRVGGGSEVVRTYDIPLRRRHRLAFSTGIISTGAPSTHYDRVNRTRAAEGGGPDEEYSTFARRSGGDWDIINPALLVSGSLFNVGGGADFYVSGGTTLRNVNNQTTLEPLVGGALGLLDRLFIQFGAHFGRYEELLLTRPGETADDVAMRDVATSITRSDAVGTRWKIYFYSGFSLRVN